MNDFQLSPKEIELLLAVQNSKRFPIVRFELKKEGEASVISTALNHVWITEQNDTMEQVKENAAHFTRLEEFGLIDISYHVPVAVASDYAIYPTSKLFLMLCAMVEEGKGKEGFLFDTPCFKKGMITLTAKGVKTLS